MTNLQSLSIFLTERLMLAAQEILKAVEVTVTEYHDEISRSRQENELLKSRLVEAGIPLYPDLQPGLSVFHEEPCAVSERGDPGEKVQVKQEPIVSREEPRVSPPQTSVHEEPVSPRACIEDEERLEEMLHSHMTDNSPSPLLNSQQCMQIKEENDELKSVVRAEIFCASQSCTSDDPSSALASNNASELETELDRLSTMQNASEMPLGCKVKSAHHKRWVQTNPIARAEYLAKRKESYQKRKQLGKIKYVKSCDLPRNERKKQRAQWRVASRNYRLKKKMAEPGLNFLPLSMGITPPLHDGVDYSSTAGEYTANTGQALTDSLPRTEPFRVHLQLKDSAKSTKRVATTRKTFH